jgi:hypothetical protein
VTQAFTDASTIAGVLAEFLVRSRCGRASSPAATRQMKAATVAAQRGRRQTIALPINSVVGCLIATILLMILSENNVRTP